MKLKYVLVLSILACATALSHHINELKMDFYDDLDENNQLKDKDIQNAGIEAITTVTFFSSVNGQQLVGQAINKIIPKGTKALRLTYQSNPVGPNRVSLVMAYINLPTYNRVISAASSTRQYDRNFIGSITLDKQLTQIGNVSWYVWAV